MFAVSVTGFLVTLETHLWVSYEKEFFQSRLTEERRLTPGVNGNTPWARVLASVQVEKAGSQQNPAYPFLGFLIHPDVGRLLSAQL